MNTISKLATLVILFTLFLSGCEKDSNSKYNIENGPWTEMFDRSDIIAGGTNYYNFNSLFFTNYYTGFAVGHYRQGATGESSAIISRTTDGGKTWMTYNFNETFAKDLTSVVFTNNLIGYASGYYTSEDTYYPIILKTSDGGQNWAPLSLSYDNKGILTSLTFTDELNGFAAGKDMYGDWEGLILKTTDGGETWNWLTFPETVTHGINSICFLDNNNGYAVGNTHIGDVYSSVILKTTDGGDNWDEITNESGDLSSVYFTDNNTGYVVAYDNSEYRDGVIKTTDGGLTWTKLSLPDISQLSLFSVKFVSKDVGYVVGDWLGIYKTNDGGSSWEDISYQPEEASNAPLFDIFFFDEDNGFVAGWDNMILKTSNGGEQILN